MRVISVDKAQKPQGTCGKCGTEIPAGSPYRWAKGRYSGRKVRCNRYECRFRPSELTGSDKKSRVFQANEQVEDAIVLFRDGGDLEDLKSAVEGAASDLNEVAGEYRDSASNMEQTFTGGSPMIDECNEKADEIEALAQECEGFQPDEFQEDEVEQEEGETAEEYEARVVERKEHEEAWREEVIAEVEGFNWNPI